MKYLSLFLVLLPTILQSQPLSGTYTIGGLVPDYTTISAAVADLNNNGTSAEVTFQIRSGIYDERVTINQFTRFGSATDEVRFVKAAGPGSVVWQNTNSTVFANWVVHLNGADYVEIDGINFVSTEVTKTYGRLIVFSNFAAFNSIENCKFTGYIVGDDKNSLIWEEPDASSINTSIRYNTFINGYRGVDFNLSSIGSKNADYTTVAVNDFRGQVDAAIVLNGAELNILGNTISTEPWALATYTAIYAKSSGSFIQKNEITMTSGAVGIRIQNSGDSSSIHDRIVNNMVSISSSDETYGIWVLKINSRVYYNTVRMDGNASSASLRIGSLANSNPALVENNILVHGDGGFALSIDDIADIESDYNNLFASGNLTRILFDGSPTGLGFWRLTTGNDQHSAEVPVFFVFTGLGSHDLHLRGSSIGDTNLAAPHIEPHNNDIDGDLRIDKFFVYMGADEADESLGFEVLASTYLSGPLLNTGLMTTSLNDNSILQIYAVSNPFIKSPLACGSVVDSVGSPTFFDDNPDIVDWICLEIRQGDPASPPMELISRKPGLIKSNGVIVDLDGSSSIVFAERRDTYFVVLYHRNHLPVMSFNAIDVSTGTGNYDFRSLGAFGTNAMNPVQGGLFAMWGGDGDWSASVTAFDFLNSWLPINGTGSGYHLGDFDMNGSGTAFDFLNVWLPANGLASQVPELD